MEEAEQHYKSLEYDVEDTHRNNPYDFICRKDKQELFVEVKGTTCGAEKILLTKNEVKHAKDNPNKCVLFLLSGIVLDRQNNIASGGQKRILQPWQLVDDDLTALQYAYDLPKETG